MENKKTIIMSIHPEYAHLILNNKKKYEYRRNRCKSDVEKILIYSTRPESLIIGEVQVKAIISGPPIDIWDKTSKYSGISKNKFLEYFRYTNIAYAYCLGKATVYDSPITLGDLGINKAPQSYVYMPQLTV